MNRQRLGTTIEVFAIAPAVYASAGPSFFTVRQFANDEGGRRDIRFAEVFGTVITLVLGVGAGLAVDDVAGLDWAPVLAAISAAALMVGMYEYALRNPRNGTDMATGAPTLPVLDIASGGWGF